MLEEHRYKGFSPNNHKSEHWEALKKEIEMQGMTVPQYQYEDLYRTIPSWTFCRKLRRQYGWRDGWNGPKME